MNTAHYILLLSLSVTITTQAQVQDSFDNGNLASPLQWYGDINSFIIDNGLLRSNSSATTNVIYLSTPVEALDEQEWQIYTKLGFSPSGSNKLKFYLLSNTQNLLNSTKAVYLEIGQTGDDAFRLVYEENGVSEIIWESKVIYSSSVEEYLKIIKTPGHEWEFFLRSSTGEYIKDTSAISQQYNFASPYAGFVCYHTSTRSDKFYFDDFYSGPIVADEEPPQIIHMEVPDENNIVLEFSEALGDGITTENFFLNGENQPVDITHGPGSLMLTFNITFKDEDNLLEIKGIPDKSGNVLKDTTLFFSFFKIGIPLTGDILINEIMADPTPPEDLPEAEYVELWNKSDKHFDLSKFQLNGNAIANEYRLLKKNSYIILCREADKEQFLEYGKVAGMAPWNILSNAGDEILLTFDREKVIDEVNYTARWYKSIIRSNGGFSLERRSPAFPCAQEYNWEASEAIKGGTPGKKNSLGSIQDLMPPDIQYIMAVGATTVEIKFNEPVNTTSFQLSDIVAEEVDFYQYVFKDQEIVHLISSTPFIKNKIYALSIEEVSDCYGNQMQIATGSFVLPDNIVPGDLIINEILFDPYPSGVDFIEVYNNTEKFLDLTGLALSNDSLRYYSVTDHPQIISPKGYIAFTTDTNRLVGDYPHARHLLQLAAMPPMPNTGGEVYLFNGDGLLDHCKYSPGFHLPFLESTEGVSLERISPEIPTNDRNNWHSAGSAAGFATPGFINSQHFSGNAPEKPLTLSSPYLTPDQNGDKDFVIINYVFKDSGLIGTFTIYDPFGKPVKSLANNTTLASSGQFTWDGTSDDYNQVKNGHYILLAEIFSVSGQKYFFKKKITVLR